MKNWDVKKLRDLADIRVSNVDKKIYPSERPVKLCNYMDVYTNEYIDGSIQFMEGSANDAEIERFGLNIGDVIITKDSETPDDIGIPTVIHEQIDNLVCGYHLALIRPDNEKIDSIFLSKYLSTSRVANYFALHASGSTRFGLPIGAIESVEILTPPIKEQTQIATILSTIDRAIEQTEALIAKQQRIKTGLMQDLLTKGIDENGNIRSEETHKFKDSPLGRIPVEWEVKEIGKVASLQRGYDIREIDFLPGNFPVIASSGIIGFHKFRTSIGPNVVVGRKGSIGNVYYIGLDFWAHDTSLFVTNFFGNHERYIYYLFVYLELERFGTKSGSPSLNRNDIHPLLVSIPNPNEQIEIARIIYNCDELLTTLSKELEKNKLQKTGLMQDLLTGKVRVTDLLNQKTATN